MRVGLVVFDVGGTTVRDSADVATVFASALERYGIATSPEKVWEWRGASKRAVIEALVTADDVRRGRPAPDLILAAMRRVGVTALDAVVPVGDTVNDLKAAEAAGVGASLGVLTGAHDRERLAAVPHTAILPSAADVPRWLADREWSTAR